MIIDAHVHLSIYQDNAKTLEEALKLLLSQMKQNGITHTIIIPDNIENSPKIADLTKAKKLIKGHNNLFLLGSPQIIQRGSSEIENYRKLLENGIIKGIKLFPGHDPYNPTDERCQPYYALLEKLNYPVVIHTGDISSDPNIKNPRQYNDPKYIVEIANKYPLLKVVITHYYFPRIEYCYKITKNTPNIYFEIAGLADGEVIQACDGIEKIRKVLKKTIDDRPEKVIYGTDWPMCDWNNKSGFVHHIELIKSLGLSQETEEMIFNKNAINIYKLPLYSPS